MKQNLNISGVSIETEEDIQKAAQIMIEKGKRTYSNIRF